MANKQDYLQIRISEDEKAELNEMIGLMDNRDMTVSQFVRDAIREKIAAVQQQKQAEPATVGA